MTALILASPFALLGIAAAVVALATGGSLGHLTDLPSHTTLDMDGGEHRG